MPIASWTASSIGVLQTITDIRPSGISAVPIVNGFVEQTTDDPTLMRTLDNSFHVRCDPVQSVGRVWVGPGQIKLPSGTIITRNGAGPPNGYYIGPFTINGQIAGQSAVQGRPGVPDAVKGCVQIFVDQNGNLTFNSAPPPPTPLTVFPSTVFPIAVVSIDSACRVYDVIDARPLFLRRLMPENKAQRQKLNRARAEIGQAVEDLHPLPRGAHFSRHLCCQESKGTSERG